MQIIYFLCTLFNYLIGIISTILLISAGFSTISVMLMFSDKKNFPWNIPYDDLGSAFGHNNVTKKTISISDYCCAFYYGFMDQTAILFTPPPNYRKYKI